MLLIKAEIKKWKRSRILIGILILTVILNLFAIESGPMSRFSTS